MANLNKKGLGNVKGALGDLVFKERYGKIYIATRPESYTTPQDPKSNTIRGKFRFSIKLFAALGKILWFKIIWKNSNIPGDINSNKMFKVNSSRITDDFDISNILLIPLEDGFKAEVTEVVFNNEKLELSVAPLAEDSGIKNYKKVSLQGLIYLRDGKEPYQFVPVVSDDIESEFGEQIKFTIRFSPLQKTIISSAGKRNFVLNIFTKDDQGEPHSVSMNIAG